MMGDSGFDDPDRPALREGEGTGGSGPGDTGTPEPDPAALATAPEFMAGLRALRIASGTPSLRDLERKTGLPRSTIAESLDPRRGHLPPLDRTMALVGAFGVEPAGHQQWAQAWKRIRLAESTAGGVTGPPPAEPPAASGVTGSDVTGEGRTGGGRTGRPDDVAAASTADERPAPAADARAVPVPGAGADTHDEVGPSRAGRTKGRFRRAAGRVAILLLGIAIGATLTVAVQRSDQPVKQKTIALSDDPGCPEAVPTPTQSASRPPHPSSAAGRPGPVATVPGPPQWIARPAADQQIVTQNGVDLPILTPVPGGDALIVTLMLTAACPGGVLVTDSEGDHFRTVADVTDSLRHRTMMLAAFGVAPLDSADFIHVAYPYSSKYHIAVDEFRGISEPVFHTTASGNSGGSAFSTSTAGQTDCAAGRLLVSAVGTNTGTAPVYVAGWTTIGVLKLSSYRLTTAYRLADSTGRCAATGTTTSQWGAVLAAFR